MIAGKIISASCASAWAICAFVSAEPNPFAWSMDGRAMCFVMAAFIGGVMAINEGMK